MNIALHQAREKASTAKSQNDLLKQEIELLKRQVELSQVNNNTQPNQSTIDESTVDEDILKDLQDNDAISKADLDKVLQQQKLKNDLELQKQQQSQNFNRAIELEKEFKNSHGSELGILSYDNIMNLHNTKRIVLSQGQLLDIQSAVSEGKNPAEVFYNSVINTVPALSKKKLEMDIKQMIKAKSSTNSKVESPQPVVDDDDFTLKSGTTDSNSHINSLLDW